MTISWQPTEGLADDGASRGMSEVTTGYLWREITMSRPSLSVMVAREERERRSRAGREGAGEPTTRRTQGGSIGTLDMLTTAQRH